jgi:hypothetical protein
MVYTDGKAPDKDNGKMAKHAALRERMRAEDRANVQ